MDAEVTHVTSPPTVPAAPPTAPSGDARAATSPATPSPLPEGDLDWPVGPVNETGVTELRVHGVGGTPPEGMLGDPHPEQVTGDRIAGMWRGDDRPIDGEPRWHREAYAWGGLTSKALSSALWLTLLPFAVLNLAGWTAVDRRPGQPGGTDWRIRYQHALVRVIGLGASWTYVLFVALIAMDLGGWQCSRDATACRLARGWEWLGLAGQPARASVVAAAAPVLMVVLLAVLSGVSRGRYEAYRLPVGRPAPLDLPRVSLTDSGLWSGGGYGGRLRTVHIASSLLPPAGLLLFVARDGGRFPAVVTAGLLVVAGLVLLSVVAAGVDRLRRLVFGRFWPPVLVAAGVLVVAAGLAWLQPARVLDRPDLMPGTLTAFNGLVVGVYTLALLLGVVAVAGWRRLGPNGWAGRTLLPGPFLAVVVAVLLLFTVWAGVAVWMARALGPLAVARRSQPPVAAIVYPGAFEWLALLAVISLVGLLLVAGGAAAVTLWWRRRRAWAELTWEREVWAGHTLPGAGRASGSADRPSGWLRTVYGWQWFAGIARWVEAALAGTALLATAAALAYSGWFTARWFGAAGLVAAVGGLVATAATLTLLVRAALRRRDRPVWLVLAVAGFAAALAGAGWVAWWLPTRDEAGPPDARLPSIGQLPLEGLLATLLTLVPIVGVLVVRQAIASPSVRRVVAVAWDVATFWPRAFHPLAPPSYAERAVPELTTRVEGLLGRGNAVLLVGHSQGAVLTLASVAQLATLPADQRERLAVVTYGNPVVNLYQRWFPVYVHTGLVDRITAAPSRWVNFFRYTDPVGRELFTGYRRDAGTRPPVEVPAGRGDCWLPDPPTDLRRPGDGPPRVRGHAHAGYLRQSAFHRHLAAEARRLAGPG